MDQSGDQMADRERPQKDESRAQGLDCLDLCSGPSPVPNPTRCELVITTVLISIFSRVEVRPFRSSTLEGAALGFKPVFAMNCCPVSSLETGCEGIYIQYCGIGHLNMANPN